MTAAPVDAMTADHLAALDEVAGLVQQRLLAAETRLQEAERAKLTAAIRLAETETSARRRQLAALAAARQLLAERADATAERIAVHVEDGERR